jgi:glycosyltransferase involved in cell wall biosynthesis
MAKHPTCTLIISTYNWPKALNLVLLSVLNQRQLPTEIVIADDGSKEETKNLIDSYRDKLSIPIKHVWHEDVGFRLAKIRNKAIATALGDYIIQIDGDVILHPYFIKDHLDFAKKIHWLEPAEYILITNRQHNCLMQRNIISMLSVKVLPIFLVH